MVWQKELVLTKETHSKWKHRRQDSWDKGVEVKEEIRVSRNDRRLVPTEEDRNLVKLGVVKSCFCYSWHQAICLKVLRQVLHQDFLCSEIVLSLNFCIILQVVHGKLFHQHDYTWIFWDFTLKFQQMFWQRSLWQWLEESFGENFWWIFYWHSSYHVITRGKFIEEWGPKQCCRVEKSQN